MKLNKYHKDLNSVMTLSFDSRIANFKFPKIIQHTKGTSALLGDKGQKCISRREVLQKLEKQNVGLYGSITIEENENRM